MLQCRIQWWMELSSRRFGKNLTLKRLHMRKYMQLQKKL